MEADRAPWGNAKAQGDATMAKLACEAVFIDRLEKARPKRLVNGESGIDHPRRDRLLRCRGLDHLGVLAFDGKAADTRMAQTRGGKKA